MKTVLCVEDNREIQILVRAALDQHSVLAVENLKEARRVLKESRVDLLVLDLELPDGDGLDLLAEIEGQWTPVFILTGKTEISKKVIAFSLGADDFLAKPFDPLELRARANAKFKKMDQATEHQNTLRIRNLTIEIEKQKVYCSDLGAQGAIGLTSLEFRLLLAFARSPERVFSRQILLDKVWGTDVNITDRTVDTHVNHLRKKLKASAVKIETVLNEGYRLV